MSTVRTFTDNGQETDIDLVASSYDPPHPTGPTPVRLGVSTGQMSNGTTATDLPLLTLATRNGRLTVEQVTAGSLQPQGTGPEDLLPALQYDTVTQPSTVQGISGQGAAPSVNALHYGNALSVDGGLVAVHGAIFKDTFFGGYGEGTPTLTFFTAGDIEVPPTALALGGSNQRGSFVGQ